MATAEDYLKNDNWVERIGESFAQFDTDNDGYVSREDWLVFVDNIAKIVTDRPALIAKLREVTLEFATALGLTEGVKADKQKFTEQAAAMAVAEVAKVKRGEQHLIAKLDNAGFDVVDRNHDGYITWDEYKILRKASNYDPDSAKATFTLLDKNKNGKLERYEFTDADFKFWFHLDDSDMF